jgi:hypothetical protein
MSAAHGTLDQRTPVTVMLDEAQVLRLEIATGVFRQHYRSIDDEAIHDFIFSTGLRAFERAIDLLRLAEHLDQEVSDATPT